MYASTALCAGGVTVGVGTLGGVAEPDADVGEVAVSEESEDELDGDVGEDDVDEGGGDGVKG